MMAGPKPRLVLALLITAPIICNIGAAENHAAEFERLFQNARRSYGLDTRLEGEWLAWPGLNTNSGIEYVVDVFLRSSDNPDMRAFCGFFLRSTDVADDFVREQIIRRSRVASDENNMPALDLGFSLLGEYELDSESIRFLAGFFSDNRVIESEEQRGPGVYLGNPIRVSDEAAGFLRGLLERENRWGPDDPTYFREPNDSMEWQDRDRVKDALNDYLLREGLIEKAHLPTHEPWVRPGAKQDDPRDKAPPRSASSPADSEVSRKQTGSSWLPAWIASGLLLAAIAIFLRSRMRAPPSEQ